MPRALAVLVFVFAVSCADRNPSGPTSSATLDGFVEGLRQQGLTVTVTRQIPTDVNRFFSVPAQEIRVNDDWVNAFVYASPQAAASAAAAISADGQPSPTVRVTWVSTPRFYRQDSLIVLYVGCTAEITRALQQTVGTPVAVGSTPCGPAF